MIITRHRFRRLLIPATQKIGGDCEIGDARVNAEMPREIEPTSQLEREREREGRISAWPSESQVVSRPCMAVIYGDERCVAN